MRRDKLGRFLEAAKVDVVATRGLATEKAKKAAADQPSWFRNTLGFEPFSYQQELIDAFNANQFLAARWCRQSGKSWIISALLLNYAVTHDDSYIAVVGPSWRQTKLNIRRMGYFLRKLPPSQYLKPGRTILRFTFNSLYLGFLHESKRGLSAFLSSSEP